MNTDIAVFFAGLPASTSIRPAQMVFQTIEARFSRFLPDSELSRVNRGSGVETEVSADFLALLELSRRYCDRTGGLFDPAVLNALEAEGYDRSFEQVKGGAASAPLSLPRASIADVVVNRDKGCVRLPAGVRLDFGGIGKGYAVDVARTALAASNFLIDAGGDIYAAGGGLTGEGWCVAVADTTGLHRQLPLLRLRDCAVATSSTTARRWRRGDGWANHLIDPRQGRSVSGEVAAVSVIAASAVEADIYAKTALILGPDEGAAFLHEQQVEGLFILNNADIVPTQGWHRYEWESSAREASNAT
jgi:thiamine biosynthesis lipoprotein